MRTLVKTTAILSILFSANAYSLGIGNIKLHSKLNQNLRANIPLFISSDEDSSELRIRLAPPDKFDEAGIPWTHFLREIKITPVINPNDTSFIQLRSNGVVKEPFLNFLLEVYTGDKTFYREFTVLLDPPKTYMRPEEPLIINIPEIEIAENKPQATIDNVRPNKTKRSSRKAKAKTQNQYGPTKHADFIWKIATKVNRYNNVSVEQMVMALFKANPKAFYKDNINALKKKQYLTIPTKNIILKLSQTEALSVINQQNDEWQERTKPKVTSQQAQISSPKTLKSSAEAKAAVRDSEKKSSNKIVEAKKETLEVSTTDTDSSTLLLAKLNKVLTRLDTLEQQVGSMKKIIIEKDETIAQLKKQAQKPQQAQELEQEQEQEKSGFSLKISPEFTDDDDKIKASEIEGILIANQNEITHPDSIATETDGVETSTSIEDKSHSNLEEDSTLTNIQEDDIKEKKTESIAVKPKVDNKQKTIKESSLPETSLDLNAWIFAIISTIVIGLFGWHWSRRKKYTETDDIYKETTHDSDDLKVDSELTAKDIGFLGEIEDFEIEDEEIDPITEANLYVSYSYYQQAENLMIQAIEGNPTRDDYKLKLLDIFYASKNIKAFESYAIELTNLNKHNNPEFWIEVVKMGVRLNPNSSLYTKEEIESVNFDTTELEDLSSTENEDLTENNNINEPPSGLNFNHETEVSSDSTDELSSDNEIDSTATSFDSINIDEEDSFSTEDDDDEPAFKEFEFIHNEDAETNETTESNNMVEFDLPVFDQEDEDSFSADEQKNSINDESPISELGTESTDNDFVDLDFLPAFDEKINSENDDIEILDTDKTDNEESTDDNFIEFDLSHIDMETNSENNKPENLDTYKTDNTEDNDLGDFDLSHIDMETNSENNTPENLETNNTEDNDLDDFDLSDFDDRISK